MNGRPCELTSAQRVFVLIFGTLCLGLGLSMLVHFVRVNLYGYWRTRAAMTVEARLTSVELEVRSNGKGSSSWTEASYDYEAGGRRFTGSRVTLFKRSEPLYLPLKRSLDDGRPIRVFIDPDDPRFAVIDREFVWFPMIVGVPFSLAFVAAGMFLGWCLWMNLAGRAIPAKIPYIPVRRTSRAQRRQAAAEQRQNG